jgi:dihydroorotase
VTIIAPDLKVRVDPDRLRSRSKNTPFAGWELRGGVAATFVAGRPVFVNADAGITV